jgi:hypothetical protein
MYRTDFKQRKELPNSTLYYKPDVKRSMGCPIKRIKDQLKSPAQKNMWLHFNKL